MATRNAGATGAGVVATLQEPLRCRLNLILEGVGEGLASVRCVRIGVLSGVLAVTSGARYL
jgi:hypothetical protein